MYAVIITSASQSKQIIFDPIVVHDRCFIHCPYGGTRVDLRCKLLPTRDFCKFARESNPSFLFAAKPTGHLPTHKVHNEGMSPLRAFMKQCCSCIRYSIAFAVSAKSFTFPYELQQCRASSSSQTSSYSFEVYVTEKLLGACKYWYPPVGVVPLTSTTSDCGKYLIATCRSP